MDRSKVTVLHLVAFAIGAGLRHFGLLASLGGGVLGLFLLVMLVGAYGFPTDDPDPFKAATGGIDRALNTCRFGFLFLMMYLASGWHCLLTFEQRGGPEAGRNAMFAGKDKKYFLYGVLYYVVAPLIVALMFVIAFLGIFGAGGILAYVVGGLCYGAFVVSMWALLGLTLPAAAIGEPITIGQAVRFLGDKLWTLAGALALVWVLNWIPGILLLLGAFLLLGEFQIESAVISQLPALLPVLVVYMGSVASAGVLTRAHMLLVPQGPKALADTFD